MDALKSTNLVLSVFGSSKGLGRKSCSPSILYSSKIVAVEDMDMDILMFISKQKAQMKIGAGS